MRQGIVGAHGASRPHPGERNFFRSSVSRTLADGFIAPCLPTKTRDPPSGGPWIHEIKHDCFRVTARARTAGGASTATGFVRRLTVGNSPP
jgi:ATP-dependent DNA ligase